MSVCCVSVCMLCLSVLAAVCMSVCAVCACLSASVCLPVLFLVVVFCFTHSQHSPRYRVIARTYGHHYIAITHIVISMSFVPRSSYMMLPLLLQEGCVMSRDLRKILDVRIFLSFVTKNIYKPYVSNVNSQSHVSAS